VLTFQDIVAKLFKYYADLGCIIWNPHHESVGAGTNNPATLLRVLGPEPLSIAYVEPSFRADDGRFGENPNRLQMHHQMQVILKPIPYDSQKIYLNSLYHLGLSYKDHDFRFVEDNWESPVIGAWGLGWEVWLDGMEITQFTYFQQAGGLALETPACELTYGLERIAMYLQKVDNIFAIQWNDNYTYGELLRDQEIEFCNYNFYGANIDNQFKLFNLFSLEAEEAISKKLPIPAYDYICRCSQAFNILDARGAISVGERANFFGRMRTLTKKVSTLYTENRKERGYPLINKPFKPELSYKPQSTTFASTSTSQEFSSETETLLIELGFEELASFIPDMLRAQLEEILPKLFKELRLAYSDYQLFITPRRVVLVMADCHNKQSFSKKRVKGPKRSIIEANPQVLEGFCRKNAIEHSEVQFQIDGTEEFAFTEITEAQEDVAYITHHLVSELFNRLNFGKSMRWLPNTSTAEKLSANRPLRWLTALYGERTLSFDFAELSSANFTYGPRWLNSPKISVISPQDYLSKLAAEGIILCSKERRRVLEDQIQSLCKEVGGVVKASEALLNEIVNLVEYPLAFIGKIDENLARVPEVVIKAVIEKHVRCLTVYEQSSGSALPLFIGVSNGNERALNNIRAGFERVIIARLTDAVFFLKRDKQRSFADFREDLNKLAIQEKLGSVFQKTVRIENLKDITSQIFNFSSSEAEDFLQLCKLAKNDLATTMVAELTSLQGEIGGIYAKESGVKAEIAQAIPEHYLPRFSGDKTPNNKLASAYAVISRLDTIYGFINIGLEPTGSTDPYALRREALGLLSILIENQIELDLNSIIRVIGESYLENLALPIKNEDKVLSFISKRLEGVLREKGFRHDVVQASIKKNSSNPFKAFIIAQELDNLLKEPNFYEILPSYLRTLKFLKSYSGDLIDLDNSELLEQLKPDSLEYKLLSKLTLFQQKDYFSLKSAWDNYSLLGLGSLINQFFAEVTIMTEDLLLRNQRVKIIALAGNTLSPYADLLELENISV
jgi:glycyl-tRNA synthetase